jgi:LPS-assembly protein
MSRLYSLILLILISSHSWAVNKSISLDETFLSAESITYDQDHRYVQATGSVVIVADGYRVTADNILYDIENDELWANGRVRIRDESDKVTVGESVFLKDKFKKGVIKQFILYLGEGSIIAAKMAQRIDEKHGKLANASYSPCKVCRGKDPMWQISAKTTELDLEKERVTYKNAFFEVYGHRVFFVPYFSHPTPRAKAQSGVLLPEIKNQRLGVPIYYRAKPNLDFTLTPRIAAPKLSGQSKHKGVIYETETRYKTKNGDYKVETSFINSKQKKGGQYYILTNGSVVENGYHYNIGLNQVSDKSYLKNYYQKRDPYLLSHASVYKTEGSNFASLKSLHFQGLRSEDKASTDPLVLPELHAKQVINIGDEKTYLTMENHTLGYQQKVGKKLSRTAMKFSLTHLHDTQGGHRLKLEGYNRSDFYHISRGANGRKTLGRNTPELHMGWQYPLIKSSSAGSILLEPEALLVLGGSDAYKNRKYTSVDMGNYILSEENLFLPNRYSGIDYHEYGTRLSYGMNSVFAMHNGYSLRGFLGKFNYLSKNRGQHGPDIVGRIAANYNDNSEVYYRFKRFAKKLAPYQEDVGFWYRNNKIDGNAGVISIKQMNYYEYASESVLTRPKMRQAYINLNYNIDENWSIGNDSRFDLISRKKASPIYRNIKVTYKGDCVSITAKFGNDYTSDPIRGIRKTRTNSVSIGLKTLM